ncbi:hypothetical protein CYMTET_39318 [Cymbomonas tetramitiformis]|uniref:Uncharacterized protein n=1 Tax=Cymbomonas tetramitiformis TaxID=36881 RepID=A0AAE0CAB0_9CHLO|nr:hypothetical protein CYMTET_39318 [Cymbomonas tetramitiformis]
MLYSGGPDVQRLIHDVEFEKQLDGATSTLVAPKVSFEEGDEPLSGFADSRRHRQQTDGKRGVSLPPSRWRDERVEQEGNDGKFHGRNTRGGRRRYTFGMVVSSLAAYSPPSPSTTAEMGDKNITRRTPRTLSPTTWPPTPSYLSEARNSLRQLKQAAGGAGEVQHFPMLHFDSATTVEDAAVKLHDTEEIAESDTDGRVWHALREAVRRH